MIRSRRAPSLPPEKAKAVADPVELALMILGLRWIPIAAHKPPLYLDFIGLRVKGDLDYEITHNRFDGTGQEGLEDLTHWFPAPRLPKRAASCPPNADALGEELKRSLARWIKDDGPGK